MKRKIYNIGLLFTIIAILFASCDDALVKSDFDYKQDSSVGLATIELNKVEKATDESISLSATVTNWGVSDVVDQGFLISEKEDFSIFSAVSISLEEHEAGAELINESYGIAQGKTFYVKAFVLSKDGMATSTAVKSINLPVTWVDAGSVKLTDNTFSGDTYDVKIQKFEGRNEYRLVDPFDTEEDGYYLRFFLDEKWNAEHVANGLQPSTDIYSFYWHTDYEGQYCNFTNYGNIYSLQFLLYRLSDNALLTGGDITFEWNEKFPGEIPEPVSVRYKTDFSDDAARTGWVLDKYSGVGEEDNVWFQDMEEVGAPSWGTSIATFIKNESYRISSPSINVEKGDKLSFGLYSGLFESGENAKVKVYIREDGGALDLSKPVKDWDLAPKASGATSISLDEYADKSIKVIFVVEQGDFLFYHFAVASTDNPSLIF